MSVRLALAGTKPGPVLCLSPSSVLGPIQPAAFSSDSCFKFPLTWKAKKMPADSSPLVGIMMGSKSDWETMRHASEILTQFGVPHESRVISAHRTPELAAEYAKGAEGRGMEI